MTASTVVDMTTVLRSVGVNAWIAGGWGIDALVGRQTRPHEDLDLIHDIAHEDLLVRALRSRGLAETLDARPVRFVMATWPIELDLHPITFSPDGSARQAADDGGGTFDYPADCFVTGRIGQTVVPCLSAAQQVYFHQGYEPRERDLHDMELLRAAFAIATHF